MAEKRTINSDRSLEHFIKKLREHWSNNQQFMRISILFGQQRTNPQNAKMWAMLSDISKQVIWFKRKHTKEQWKMIVTGTLWDTEMVPNMEGSGLVSIGHETSKMNTAQLAEVIEYLYAFGEEKQIVWSEPAKR